MTNSKTWRSQKPKTLFLTLIQQSKQDTITKQMLVTEELLGTPLSMCHNGRIYWQRDISRLSVQQISSSSASSAWTISMRQREWPNYHASESICSTQFALSNTSSHPLVISVHYVRMMFPKLCYDWRKKKIWPISWWPSLKVQNSQLIWWLDTPSCSTTEHRQHTERHMSTICGSTNRSLMKTCNLIANGTWDG